MKTNRFKKKMNIIAEDITNTESCKNRSKEVKKFRDIEDKFYQYQNLVITNSKNGEKFKANFSLSKETMQKINFMQMYGGFKKNENSKLPTIAIDVLYQIFYDMQNENINIFELDKNEILSTYLSHNQDSIFK